jgi:uncharacterized protein YgiM (DUF1202 family)
MGQGGTIKLSVVIAAVLGLGFGSSAFLNYQQHQQADQDKKLLQGEIVDLRYQLKQDQLAAAGGSPSPSPSASPSPDPSASPTASPSPQPSTTPAVLGDNAPAPKTATVKTAANLHSGPSAKSSTLIKLVPAGTLATLGSNASGGYQQITINGKTGYMLASFLQY